MKKNIFFFTLNINSIVLLLAALVSIFAGFFTYGKITSANNSGIKVPIIMYHSILKDESKSGDYIITPTQLEDDLKYLKENGYTCIFVNDLIEYEQNGTALPDKPIILTFDDGHYNNKTYLLPLLEKYNQKAVISIVGKYTENYSEHPDENPNYAYLSWKNVNELLSSGRIEIGNHSYDMHSIGRRKGTHKIKGETSDAYAAALTSDIEKMQTLCRNNLGTEPKFFTYPFGSVSTESYDILKNCGFSATLSCGEGINYITGDKDELYMLKRCIRTSRRSVCDILSDT